MGGAYDPTWAELDHHAGVDGADVGLNRLNPRYFLINDKGGRSRSRTRTSRCARRRARRSSCACSTRTTTHSGGHGHGRRLRLLGRAPVRRGLSAARDHDVPGRALRHDPAPAQAGRRAGQGRDAALDHGQGVLGSAETLITVTGQALPDPPPSNLTRPPARPVQPAGGYGQPAPAAQPRRLRPRPRPPRRAKPAVKGKKVVSKKRKKKLSLRERLRRRRKVAADGHEAEGQAAVGEEEEAVARRRSRRSTAQEAGGAGAPRPPPAPCCRRRRGRRAGGRRRRPRPRAHGPAPTRSRGPAARRGAPRVEQRLVAERQRAIERRQHRASTGSTSAGSRPRVAAVSRSSAEGRRRGPRR